MARTISRRRRCLSRSCSKRSAPGGCFPAPDRGSRRAKKNSAKISRAVAKHFAAQWKKVNVALSKIAKLDDSDRQRILDELAVATDPEQVAALQKELADAIGELAAHAGTAAVQGVADAADLDAIDDVLSQANQRSVAYADARAGELITEIDETTRENIRDLIARGIEEGWTNDEFSQNLSDSFTFDSTRADLIARTESAFAENRGTLDGWKASGLVEQKQWLADPDACDDCQELNGEIVDLDDDFSSGDDGPPAHPNCECTLLAVLAGDDGEE